MLQANATSAQENFLLKLFDVKLLLSMKSHVFLLCVTNNKAASNLHFQRTNGKPDTIWYYTHLNNDNNYVAIKRCGDKLRNARNSFQVPVALSKHVSRSSCEPVIYSVIRGQQLNEAAGLQQALPSEAGPQDLLAFNSSDSPADQDERDQNTATILRGSSLK